MVIGLVGAIRLPQKGSESERYSKRVTLAGYGITYLGVLSTSKSFWTQIADALKKRAGFQISEMRIINCTRFFGFESDEHLCTFGGSQYTSECFGQPGGPLVATDEKGPTLIGVAHFVHNGGCIVKYPAVFTRVRNYLGWIKSVTGPL